jgi:hypothetical protein
MEGWTGFVEGVLCNPMGKVDGAETLGTPISVSHVR